MPATLDIVGKNYYMVIVLLKGMLHFVPCNLLTASLIIASYQDYACLQIKDSCITNRSQDKVLSVTDTCIEDYVNRTGNKDCGLVENFIGKMFQKATTGQHAEHDNLIQLFIDAAIVQAVENSGFHQDVNEEALKLWIYVIITPTDWGKIVSNDAFLAVFAGSSLITPSSALVMAAFETLLHLSYWGKPVDEHIPLYDSQNLLCELSVDKSGEAALSMNIFMVLKPRNGPDAGLDPFLSKPTIFSNNRIQMNVGHRGLVALLRDAVCEKIGLSALFCNELLSHLCEFLFEMEDGHQQEGSKMLNQIYPFQECDFSEVVTNEDVAALRLITLQDIYAVLSPQLQSTILEIQAAIERELFITRVFFIEIPEVSSFYPQHIEDTLFVCIVLLKFKLEEKGITGFEYLHDKYRRYYGASMVWYDPIDKHIRDIVLGVTLKVDRKVRTIYRDFPPLSSLVKTIRDTGRIDKINYVYLSTSQVLMQSVNVYENGAIKKLSIQKSEVIALDQFLEVNDSDSRFNDTTLRFRISESALLLLESMFPRALQEFATLYRRPLPKEDVASMPCLDQEKWHPEADEHDHNYTKLMTDLVHHQSKSDSPRIYMTQQKHIVAFLTVYFGYLKETLAKDFGEDSDSTRYILIFEHLLRNATIGQKDNILMQKAVDRCGWVSETEENKRKLMVYDIEDSFPVSECLQKENIRKIPANQYFAVVTMTRYYIKTSLYQALEDILPTDKYYKAIKLSNSTYHIDFYDMICERIWRHVIENVYETDTLLECPSEVDIMDIAFTLEAYKSFKKAFLKYMLNTFSFTYASQPDEKHRFSLQTNCSIVLTNRLVLNLGVLPALKSFIGLARHDTQPMDFVFYRPSNFDDQENLSFPMLKLMVAEVKRLVEIHFEKLIWVTERQFSFVHSYQYLNPFVGDTIFGYDALKTGVIRGIRADTFAVSFQYLIDDKESFIEVMTGRPGPPQFVGEGDACIITKAGSPYDNISSDVRISDIAFKIPDLTSVQRVFIYKIHDIHQKNIGDIIKIQNCNCAIMICSDIGYIVSGDDFERFKSYPIVNPQHEYYFSGGYNNTVKLYSFAMERSLETMFIIQPVKLAYFDSYELRF